MKLTLPATKLLLHTAQRALEKYQVPGHVSESTKSFCVYIGLPPKVTLTGTVCILLWQIGRNEIWSFVGGYFTQMKLEALWYSYDGVLFLCYANLTISERKIYNVRFTTFSQQILYGKLLYFWLLVITCYLGFVEKLL